MKFLIWNLEKQLWYRASFCGYTSYVQDAGQYSLKEASNLIRTDDKLNLEDIIIPVPATHTDFSNLIQLLTLGIGCYGDRQDNPVRIIWGNGVALSTEDNKGRAAGTGGIGKWIALNKR